MEVGRKLQYLFVRAFFKQITIKIVNSNASRGQTNQEMLILVQRKLVGVHCEVPGKELYC